MHFQGKGMPPALKALGVLQCKPTRFMAFYLPMCDSAFSAVRSLPPVPSASSLEYDVAYPSSPSITYMGLYLLLTLFTVILVGGSESECQCSAQQLHPAAFPFPLSKAAI